MYTPIIRRATPDDAPALLELIDALAAFENLRPPDAPARNRLTQDLARVPPRFEAYIAFADNIAAGYAVVLETYSSFLALPTLYLEDLFILPQFRRSGIGSELFRFLVMEACNRGCGRMDWSVLAWNSEAINFYESRGARHEKEWHLYRIDRTGMESLLAR